MLKNKKGNLAEQAYEVLKKKIIKGDLKPGEYLNENILMTEINIGLTPLRQAVLLLKNEGFVESEPHRSSYVKEYSLDEVKELIEALVILEKKITQLSILRISDLELGAIKKVQDKYDAIIKEFGHQKDMTKIEKIAWKIVDLNYEFHHRISLACKNRFLNDAYKRIRVQLERFAYVSVVGELRSMIDQQSFHLDSSRHHQEILESLQKKDAKLLEHVIVEHVKYFQRTVYDSLMDISYG